MVETPPAMTDARRKVRVLLADDHHLVREGLRSILSFDADVEVVGEADNGRSALEMAHIIQPDVILMDINMPQMNGIEATRRIHQELPNIKVVGLSMHNEDHMAQAMRDAGAVAFITKGVHSDDLVSAIISCARRGGS